MREFKFPSSSGPKIYTTMIGDNGLLSCTCPGWTVKKMGKARFCKHCEKVKNDERLTLEERDGQMFVTSFVSGTEQRRTAPLTSTKRQERSSEFKAPDEVVPHNSGFVNPMLASAMPEGKTVDSYANGDWIAEEKFDGHRIIIRVSRETAEAWSRLGNRRGLPHHIHDLAYTLPVGVYDGELIVPGNQHSYSVTAGQSTGREALVLFDMLEVDGKSIMKTEQHVRRAFLQIAMDALPLSKNDLTVRMAWQFIPSLAKVQEIWDRGGEGAIIKKLSGKYSPGWRSADWIKVKAVANATLTIIGFENGKNGPYSIVRLRDKNGIETTVKTLNNSMMRQFAANPESFIGRGMVVSYQERMPSGKLRHIMADHLVGE